MTPKKPRTRKAGKVAMEWCVVLRCSNRKQAGILPELLIGDGYIGYIPHVMRLPKRGGKPCR